MQIWFFHIWINILNFIIQCFQPVLLKKWRVIFSFLLYRYMKIVRYVMDIERYLKSISFKYWNEHYILLKYSPRFDLHNFNPWSHFWNASQKWFNLGWSGSYEMMAEQKNCRNLERRPDKWKKKKVTWTIFVEYGECGKGVTLSIPKNCFKGSDVHVCDGASPWSRRTGLNPDTIVFLELFFYHNLVLPISKTFPISTGIRTATPPYENNIQ